MGSNNEAVMALKLIAATAEKLAYDLEHNRLWPGQLAAGAKVIAAQLADVKEAR